MGGFWWDPHGIPHGKNPPKFSRLLTVGKLDVTSVALPTVRECVACSHFLSHTTVMKTCSKRCMEKNGISWENMGMILNFHLPWSPWTMIIWLKYVTTCNPSAKQTEGCARCRYIMFFSKGGNCPNMNCLRPIRRPNHQISSPAYKMKQGGQQGRKEPIGQSLPKKCGWLVVWNINYWEFHHPKWLFLFFRGVAQPPTRWNFPQCTGGSVSAPDPQIPQDSALEQRADWPSLGETMLGIHCIATYVPYLL